MTATMYKSTTPSAPYSLCLNFIKEKKTGNQNQTKAQQNKQKKIVCTAIWPFSPSIVAAPPHSQTKPRKFWSRDRSNSFDQLWGEQDKRVN